MRIIMLMLLIIVYDEADISWLIINATHDAAMAKFMALHTCSDGSRLMANM